MWVLCAMMLNLLQVSTLPSFVFPVYPSGSVVKGIADNDTMDVVVSSMYRAAPDIVGRRSRGPATSGLERTTTGLERRFDSNTSTEASPPAPINSDFSEQDDDMYMKEEREACNEHSIASCWSYNFMHFVNSFTRYSPSQDALTLGRKNDTSTPLLVQLPVQINGSLTVLGRSGAWGLGNLYFFLERQLSRYIEGHAILFPAATSWEEAIVGRFQTPVVLNDSENEIEDPESFQRKTKKKSILFPLLILFKFFKIKMILLPILLTVLLIKKLLIVALALAPNIAGFFRVCRPPSPFGPQFGLAPAGLLQDVTDSRGEFSSMYHTYANPYRDYNGYRTRDWARYANQPPVTEQMPNFPADYDLN